MASVLDLRRRIRSVKSTRQITKAMKMVSAARLRRAQARAMAARPYAQMITSVLGSLIRRIEIIDPETGNLRHPLFAARPEKRVLLLVVSGDNQGQRGEHPGRQPPNRSTRARHKHARDHSKRDSVTELGPYDQNHRQPEEDLEHGGHRAGFSRRSDS